MHNSTPHKILQEVWGYNEFRTGQLDIINAIIAGKDCLALLPTGGGKSICYQVPALALEGCCLVVSPLVALMKDQVRQLKSKGVRAEMIYSGQNRAEIDIVLENAALGHYQFLYVSPERLQNELFLERFKRMHLSLLAIDEAHCISQWGFDFRPAYLAISELRALRPQLPCLALTATATTAVEKDIVELLAFRDNHFFYRKSFDRDNLVYAVTKTDNKFNRLLFALGKNKGSSLIYVRNRRLTKTIAGQLNDAGYKASYYHAGLSHKERDKRQRDWLSGELPHMVCTNAFGMGIDKPDVRLVIHWAPPDSLEAYYQEAGRAGRDGNRSYAVLLYDDQDIQQLWDYHEKSFPDIPFIRKIYQALGNYLQLAYGAGEGEAYDFDLTAFAKIYNLDLIKSFSALKQLEHAGYLHLSDAVFSPAKVRIRLSSAEVYRFMVGSKKHEALLKALMRLYGGILEHLTSVNLNRISKLTGGGLRELDSQMQELQKQSVIDYLKPSDKPRVTCLMPRQKAEHLQFDVKRLEFLKERAAERISGIADYVSASGCRSKQLLAYFDENLEEDCGHCDFCLSNKKNNVQEIILQLLSSGTNELSVLKMELEHQGVHQLDELRKMLENGIVRKEGNRIFKAD